MIHIFTYDLRTMWMKSKSTWNLHATLFKVAALKLHRSNLLLQVRPLYIVKKIKKQHKAIKAEIGIIYQDMPSCAVPSANVLRWFKFKGFQGPFGFHAVVSKAHCFTLQAEQRVGVLEGLPHNVNICKIKKDQKGKKRDQERSREIKKGKTLHRRIATC